MWKTLLLLSCVAFLTCIVSHVTFTNLKCDNVNRKYGEFEYCEIKAVNRTHKYLSTYYKLNTRSLENVTINLKALRNNFGYKPFFLDITIDACKFLKNPRNPAAILFFKILKRRSNMNHTCPYNHDIKVERLYTGDHETEFTQFVPIPAGDYAIFMSFSVNNDLTCIVKLYMKITKN